MAVFMAMPWHEGEKKMHEAMRVPSGMDNPTVSMLSPQAANMLQRGTMIAVGTLDSDGRPWTTIWGGEAGMSQPLGSSIIGIKTPVDQKHDPVVEILFGTQLGAIVKEEDPGRMIGGLTIDLNSRKRVKLYGRMIAGAVQAVEDEEEPDADPEDVEARVQLAVRINQSLGNCPKYLNRKDLKPVPVHSALVSSSPDLSKEALQVIDNADLFFISSSHGDEDMDTNHRGGPAGFVRRHQTDGGAWEVVWPEYSGNRLYQTLGNLYETPRAGLVFPDFLSGDVLYLTGETNILIGADAAKVIPRSNLAVKLTVTAARFVRRGLPFRGTPVEQSPYNPKVRPLADETPVIIDADQAKNANTAKLLEKKKITPTIARYRFTMNNPTQWKAGQWVALDFSYEMDIGYSHMRDEDPLSINDDFIRTFTVSSPPAPRSKRSDDEFEITIRRVGPVTGFLAEQSIGYEMPVRGFGGDVSIEQEQDGKVTPFLAGGVGITPLLAQIPSLDLDRLKVFWTLHMDDIDLAVDMIRQSPGIAKDLSLFLTGANGADPSQKQSAIDELVQGGATVEKRRIEGDDLKSPELSDRWHVCVSTRLRESLMKWLEGKELVYEDFNF